MNKSDDSLSFRQMLDYCSDPQSPQWQFAWREFINRYKKYMYNVIIKRCLQYKNPRIHQQLEDIVHDILLEVCHKLCDKECKALKDFRGRDEERIFLAWLATICNYSVYSYVQRNFFGPLLDENIAEVKYFVSNFESEIRWQIYEDMVNVLRNSKKKKGNTERDINIFLLYIWADFSMSMIKANPCLKNIGHRVLDNVVHRMRACLRENKNILESF